jgi:hypothetical protein
MDHADTRLESGAQLLCDKVWSAHGELHVKTSYTKKFPDSSTLLDEQPAILNVVHQDLKRFGSDTHTLVLNTEQEA